MITNQNRKHNKGFIHREFLTLFHAGRGKKKNKPVEKNLSAYPLCRKTSSGFFILGLKRTKNLPPRLKFVRISVNPNSAKEKLVVPKADPPPAENCHRCGSPIPSALGGATGQAAAFPDFRGPSPRRSGLGHAGGGLHRPATAGRKRFALFQEYWT